MLRITKWQKWTVLDAVVFHPGDPASCPRHSIPFPQLKEIPFPSLGLALSPKESPQPRQPTSRDFDQGQGNSEFNSSLCAIPESWHFWRKSKGDRSDQSVTVSHYCTYWGSDQAQGQGSSGSSKTTLKVSAEWVNHLGSAARSTGSEPAASYSLFKCLFN